MSLRRIIFKYKFNDLKGSMSYANLIDPVSQSKQRLSKRIDENQAVKQDQIDKIDEYSDEFNEKDDNLGGSEQLKSILKKGILN